MSARTWTCDDRVVLRGVGDLAPELRPLAAGPWEALLGDGELRAVRWNGVEVLRRIYPAVRDPDWGTVPADALEVETLELPDSLVGSWRAQFERGELRLVATGRYELRRDGSLVARFRADPAADFPYNRIGLCLLHPPAEFAGRRYVAGGPHGGSEGVLPTRIGPQPIVAGIPAPLFPAFERLDLDTHSGPVVRLTFEGDQFEIEDQRNWTDDSFKIYSTPLALGWPHAASAGRAIEQTVILAVTAKTTGSKRRSAAASDVVLTLGDEVGRELPKLGLGAPSHDEPLSDREVELLRLVRPAHVHVTVPGGGPVMRQLLERAAAVAAALSCRIQVAILLGAHERAELEELRAALARSEAGVAEVIVLEAGREATGGRLVRLAREVLADAVGAARFHGGTNAGFCELNRADLDLDGLDGLVYPIQPQIHASDDDSLFETLSVQGETVETARERFPGLAVLAAPVTLCALPRPGDAVDTKGLPPTVDVRQASLLAAAWTVGSLKYLAEAGADALTYYETTGWRGLLETEAGPPEPEFFPSAPGLVFPLFHVLADAAELSGGLRAVHSSEPLRAVALAAAEPGVALRLIAANLRAAATDVRFDGLPGAQARIRRLNVESAEDATMRPEEFRASRWEPAEALGGTLRLRLEPYEVVRVEVADR